MFSCNKLELLLKKERRKICTLDVIIPNLFNKFLQLSQRKNIGHQFVNIGSPLDVQRYQIEEKKTRQPPPLANPGPAPHAGHSKIRVASNRDCGLFQVYLLTWKTQSALPWMLTPCFYHHQGVWTVTAWHDRNWWIDSCFALQPRLLILILWKLGEKHPVK